ncbi:Cathepsin_L [Hexamita inflata]|uniref:Cathepsin L n=1 Tax=Hexamita inflata TaxID=28002 RepID=A0AA86QKL0_9EUKA|nr:Cathepsin L [Hexamita inflata]
MITLIQTLSIIINTYLPCGHNYKRFQQNYNSVLSKTEFCKYYDYLPKQFQLNLPQQLGQQQTSQHTNIPNKILEASDEEICTDYAIPLYPFERHVIFEENLPLSVDFRESGLITRAYNQGKCGACEVFVAAEMAETFLLRDYDSYYLNPSFGNSSRNLSISIDFMLRNSINNEQCDGANYYILMSDMVLFKTFETTANFPYDDRKKKYELASPKIPESDFFQPFALNQLKVRTKSYTCLTNVIIIKQFDGKTFTQQESLQIKHLLARGLPVQGSMQVMQPDLKYQVRFQLYKNGILQGPCEKPGVDHSIMFIGYGHFKSKPVWVFRNSWGSSWGKEGIFYIEQGSNSYCSEMQANSNLPKTETIETLLENNWRKQFGFQAEIIYDQRRGFDGLDFDDGTFKKEPEQGGRLFFACTFSMFVLWVLAMIGMCIGGKIVQCKKKKAKQSENEALVIQTDEL